MSISQTVVDFVTLAIQAGGWMELDRLYLQNRILTIIGENSIEPIELKAVVKTPLDLVDELICQAKKNEMIGENPVELEQLEAQLMDFLTPPPSVVNAFFAKYYEKDPKEATNYFYEVNKRNNFIKTKTLTKNDRLSIQTEYGELEMKLDAAISEKSSDQRIPTHQRVYPKCLFCMENEGYRGNEGYPPRTNFRMIRMNLHGESWNFHYSPIAYFNEQSIISAEEHRSMVVSKATFTRLMKIIEVFPHYFAGFDGGQDQLIHEHYQTGCEQLPLEKSEIEDYFELADYPLLNAGIVKWPLSVIRLTSPNPEDLIGAGSMILEKWQQYSDETISIGMEPSEEMFSQTIAAVARRKSQLFELDIILQRDNLSERSSLQLTEMMGLVVLPKNTKGYRLEDEAQVTSNLKLKAKRMKKSGSFNETAMQEGRTIEVGQRFLQSLTDAAVFKRTTDGQTAFKRFISSI